MVNHAISNIYDFQNSEEGINFLKDCIERSFPEFDLVEIYNNGSLNGFSVTYKYYNINIKLGCERHSLTHLIEVENHKFTLYKFDEGMKEVLAFSRKNIIYTLAVLKRVLDEMV